MTTPAITLAPFRSPAPAFTPSIGTGSTQLIPLVPVAEPISVGAPPTAPNFVTSVDPGYDGVVRSRRTASGHLKTSTTRSAPRPRFSVEWRGLSKSERDALWAWILQDLGVTEKAFTVELDGVDGGGEANLRMLSTPEETHAFAKHRGGGEGGPAEAHVYHIGPVQCEEVIS